MRFRQAKRCGSASWWGIALSVLLLASTYVVFDLLDVDGSQMRPGPAREMMLDDTLEIAAERVFRAAGTPAASTDLLALSLPRLSADAPSRNSATKASLHQRWGHVPPRAMLAAERAGGSSPTGDPL